MQIDSTRFLPLEVLLQQVKEVKADYLILFGPFIDEKNQFFQSGEILIDNKYLTYEEMFTAFLDLIMKELKD